MTYVIIKRWFDIVCAGTMLLALLPLCILLAVLIRLDSPGSPLFLQQRVGRFGVVFNIVKFRSMVKDAPNRGPYWTQENDPRITRIGRFIRSTSLDELPQIWNVLRGDMSIVGPRPDAPAQEVLYPTDLWVQRHRVRPGITGLAQVNGRSHITPQERLQYDLDYAEHASLAMDMRILEKTIMIVLRKTGAN